MTDDEIRDINNNSIKQIARMSGRTVDEVDALLRPQDVTLKQLQGLRETVGQKYESANLGVAAHHTITAAISAHIGGDSLGLRQSLTYALQSILDHDLDAAK